MDFPDDIEDIEEDIRHCIVEEIRHELYPTLSTQLPPQQPASTLPPSQFTSSILSTPSPQFSKTEIESSERKHRRDTPFFQIYGQRNRDKLCNTSNTMFEEKLKSGKKRCIKAKSFNAHTKSPSTPSTPTVASSYDTIKFRRSPYFKSSTNFNFKRLK